MTNKQIIVLLMASLLSACSVVESANAPRSNTGSPAPVQQNASSLEDVLVDGEEEQASISPNMYPGNDRLIGLVPERAAIRLLGEDVSINFEQAPLMEVVQAIMGDILELDYIIDVPIPGQVTLRTNAPIPRDQLFTILESLLESRQASIVRLSDGRFFITGSETAFRIAPSLSSIESRGVGSGIVVIPLEYISAADMAEILSPVADDSAFIRIDQVRNLLMMAGSRIQVDGWLDIIATFDVDMLAGMSVGIFPIENMDVEEIQNALGLLLDGSGENGNGGLLGLIRIVPLEDLNSLLIVTPRAQYLTQVEEWIERLDQAPNSGTEPQLYVYPVQNRSVGELAELLTGIYGGGNSAENQAGGSVAPGMTPEQVSSAGASANVGNSSSGSVPSNQSYVIGDARVVADEGNNSLLIYTTGRDYRRISRALQQLDVVPTQVLIEASIIEVTLSDSLQYGFQWALQNDIGNNNLGLANFTPSDAPSSGLSYTVTSALTGDIRGVLRALAGNSLLNVISTPSVMALDNYTAILEAGSSVPYNAGSFVSAGLGGVVTNNIAYRDVGVNLEVTPSVNAGGLVTLDILQSVTDIGPVEPVSGLVQFDQRSIESRVAVRSGETVVLGGLIRDNRTETRGGVPVLYKLPIVGNLFGSTAFTTKQTELVVLITPTVIFNDQDLRDATNTYRQSIRNLDLMDLPEGR